MTLGENEANGRRAGVERSGTAPGRAAAALLGLGIKLFRPLRSLRRFFAVTIFSSLTRRIVILNLAALAATVAGILYLNQWRAGLIDARVQSLRIQGEIIAAAIAASATVDSDVIAVNPDRLLQSQGGGSLSSLSFFDPALEFPINPERVAPLLGNLVTPTRTRARIYDKGGLLILDSSDLFREGDLLAPLSPPPAGDGFFLFDWWNTLTTWLPGDRYSVYVEYGPDQGRLYPEVVAALTGSVADIARVDGDGQMVISVAVPVQRLRAIVGVLLLSTQPGDIESIIRTARWSILRLALVAALVTSLLSFLLAGTIAGPMRRLSAAAERVKTLINTRAEIPDFTERSDEIGMLSGSLRDMTNSLYNRIEDIERFAADVAHELKNPLTSLRSAVETLPRVRRTMDRDRLIAIIQHDVRRLDRLISDISNASRLDAELARQSAKTVDIEKLAEAVIAVQHEEAAARGLSLQLEKRKGRHTARVIGHDSRLAQIVANLLDNAISFSPRGGAVTLAIKTSAQTVTLTVTDEGPGIKGDVSRIFRRFYTDRPETEQFGNHSGLGLSISRQIVEAHKGTLVAANRTGRSGAIFTVTLPRVSA